jgi:hypothetical protein
MIRKARPPIGQGSIENIAVAVRLLDRCEVGAVVEDHHLAPRMPAGLDQRLCHPVVPTGRDEHGAHLRTFMIIGIT